VDLFVYLNQLTLNFNMLTVRPHCLRAWTFLLLLLGVLRLTQAVLHLMI